MNNITKFVCEGLKSVDEKLFMARVMALLEKKQLIEYLADGVPMEVEIEDEEKLYQSVGKNKKNVRIVNAAINNDFIIEVTYEYDGQIRWFKDEETAAAYSSGTYVEDKVEQKSDEYPCKGARRFTSTETFDILSPYFHVTFL